MQMDTNTVDGSGSTGQVQPYYLMMYLLFMTGILTSVLMVSWNTRGVQSWVDATLCCYAAVVVNCLSWAFVTAMAVVAISVGLSDSEEHCRAAFFTAAVFYMPTKLSTGAYFLAKMFEIHEGPKKNSDRNVKPYYVDIGIMGSGFLICFFLVLFFGHPYLHHTNTNPAVCTLNFEYFRPVLAALTVYVGCTNTYISMNFIKPFSRFNSTHVYHPRATACWIAIIATSLFPLADLLYLLFTGGSQSAWTAFGGALADAFCTGGAVWWVEGCWNLKRARKCKCAFPVVKRREGQTEEEDEERVEMEHPSVGKSKVNTNPKAEGRPVSVPMVGMQTRSARAEAAAMGW